MVLKETIRDPDHRQPSRSVSTAQSVAAADVVIAVRKWLPGVGVVAPTENTGLIGHGARATEAVKGGIRCSSPWAVIAYTRM
jgi:hypothetical protein